MRESRMKVWKSGPKGTGAVRSNWKACYLRASDPAGSQSQALVRVSL